ncbi:hypothetical protein CWN54_07905, partial [Klebsiella pneumoniae]
YKVTDAMKNKIIDAKLAFFKVEGTPSTGHVVVIGKPSSGKSFCLTDEITRLLKAGKNHEN